MDKHNKVYKLPCVSPPRKRPGTGASGVIIMELRAFAILLAALVLLAACQQSLLGDNTTGIGLHATLGPQTPATEPATPAAANATGFTVTKTEGDLVILAPQAYDPDGDAVTYTFSAPFDSLGRWQTGYGDAGEYHVTVTATDPHGASAVEQVTVIIRHADRKPVLHCPRGVVVREGQTVRIGCTADDYENGTVTLTYYGWMTADNYTTTYQDAGSHTVTVKAVDEAGLSAEQDVTVTVQDVNRPPVFPADYPTRIEAQEGDIITLPTADVTDPDGQRVSFTFSSPFDSKGVWRTGQGDAGTWPVEVVASDGFSSATARVEVVVRQLNTPPVLQPIPDVRVHEGETITLPLHATDREGGNLTYTVTGWMTSPTYTTTYDDAGTYTTKVTVSDGQFSDSQVVHITVLDTDRPPVFTVPG